MNFQILPQRPCGCDEMHHSDLLSVEQATEICRSLVKCVRETERVRLMDALGRVNASKLEAPLPMPFFNQAAMDGFAVNCGDLVGSGPWRLPVADTVVAGDAAPGEALPGRAAVRIFTGAPVPPGTDLVVMAETCEDHGSFVTVTQRPDRGANIRRAGSDIKQGRKLVGVGQRIGSRHVGLLAANGFTVLDVFRRPRVGIFSTGTELLSRNAPKNGGVFDANRPMLMALCTAAGAEVTDLGIVDDDPGETKRFFRSQAGQFDMLISSGGISAGARDCIPASLRESGGNIHGAKVALKPGKPILFATLGSAAYLALPGNPLAAYVGFQLFGRDLICRLGGNRQPMNAVSDAVAGFSLDRKPGRTEFVPARVVSRSPAGIPELTLLGNGSSGTLHALCQADGLAVIPSTPPRIGLGDRLGFITGHAEGLV